MKPKRILSAAILLLLIFVLSPSPVPERGTNESSKIPRPLPERTELSLPTSVFFPKEDAESVFQKSEDSKSEAVPPQDMTSGRAAGTTEDAAVPDAPSEDPPGSKADEPKDAPGEIPSENKEKTSEIPEEKKDAAVPDAPSENPPESKVDEPKDAPGEIPSENKEKTSEIPEEKEDAAVPDVPKETPKEDPPSVPETRVRMVPLGKTPEKAPERYRSFLAAVKAVENGMRNSVYTDDCGVFSTGAGEYIYFDFPLEELSDALSYLFPYTEEQQRYSSGIAYGRNFFFVLDGKLEELTAQETKERNYVQKAASVVSHEMTEWEAYRAIHDYVCGYLDYDYAGTHRSLLDGFDSHLGVCETYARMTKAVCEQVGIECEYYEAKIPNGNHAWNRVRIDGVWYWTDACWDGGDEETTYRYYLSETLWENHRNS